MPIIESTTPTQAWQAIVDHSAAWSQLPYSGSLEKLNQLRAVIAEIWHSGVADRDALAATVHVSTALLRELNHVLIHEAAAHETAARALQATNADIEAMRRLMFGGGA